MINGMIKAHPTQDRMARQAAIDPPPHLLGLDPIHRSRAADLCPVLIGPAASRGVAEDAHEAPPFQHRVDQVTVQERDGVDVGQPGCGWTSRSDWPGSGVTARIW
jgi:hypothetical protein